MPIKISDATTFVDFEDLANQYAENEAKKDKHSLEWSDIHFRQTELLLSYPQFHECMKLQVIPSVLNYDNKLKPVPASRPGKTLTEWFANVEDMPQSYQVNMPVECQSSATWIVQKGIKIGSEVTAWGNVPSGFGANTRLSMPVRLNDARQQTRSETLLFNVSHTIEVPPKSTTKVVISVLQKDVEVPWEVPITFIGSLAMKYEDPPEVAFVPLTEIAKEPFEVNPESNSVQYRARGVFQGVFIDELVLKRYDYDEVMVEVQGKRNEPSEDPVRELVVLRTRPKPLKFLMAGNQPARWKMETVSPR